MIPATDKALRPVDNPHPVDKVAGRGPAFRRPESNRPGSKPALSAVRDENRPRQPPLSCGNAPTLERPRAQPADTL
ncbi:hypothetical protein DSC45_26980 [Streptomyces sp. YIM 130001]|nr:hypothetical protein DSC45_26980 [Streptomyces sp. YIM 130001]